MYSYFSVIILKHGRRLGKGFVKKIFFRKFVKLFLKAIDLL